MEKERPIPGSAFITTGTDLPQVSEEPESFTNDYSDDIIASVESASENLIRVERDFKNLAPILARINEQLFREQRSEFDALVTEAEKHILRIRASLVVLETKIESEYLAPPMTRRLILWILSLFSKEARRLRDIHRNAQLRHNALATAASSYTEMLDNQEQRINGIISTQALAHCSRILAENNKYQSVCLELEDLKEQDEADAWRDEDRDARIKRLKRDKKRMEAEALQQAKQEIAKIKIFPA